MVTAAAKAALALKRRREAAENSETVATLTVEVESLPKPTERIEPKEESAPAEKSADGNFIAPVMPGPKKLISDTKPKKSSKKFEYGNYNRYYGYRNPGLLLPGTLEDPRLFHFRPEWFFGKDVLVSFFRSIIDSVSNLTTISQ
jgi:hypothetical protein